MLADADRPNIRKKFKRWELSSPGRGLALLGLVRLVGRWLDPSRHMSYCIGYAYICLAWSIWWMCQWVKPTLKPLVDGDPPCLSRVSVAWQQYIIYVWVPSHELGIYTYRDVYVRVKFDNMLLCVCNCIYCMSWHDIDYSTVQYVSLPYLQIVMHMFVGW